jgi:Uma2 family endonuclease
MVTEIRNDPVPESILELASERALNADDLRRFPDDRNRYEIIGGELFVSPAPPVRHQLILVNLVTIFHEFLESRRKGIGLCAPLDVYLSYYDVVQPDLLVVLNNRKSIIFEHGIVGVPNLIVEVLTSASATVDKIRKTALYGRNRVEEYWIVDPLKETVTVSCLYGDRYSGSVELQRDGRLYSPALQGLVLDLDTVFPGPTWPFSADRVAESDEVDRTK